MSAPSAPIFAYPPTSAPPFKLPDDLPPKYTDELPLTDAAPTVRLDEETHPSVETAGLRAESLVQKTCKLMCVTTNSSWMVIAWTVASTFFSGIGLYWVFATLPDAHDRDTLTSYFYPMSAVLVMVLLLSPVYAVAGDVRCGNFGLMVITIVLNVFGLIVVAGLAVSQAVTQEAFFTYFIIIGYILVFLAGAMFQANAIQLGRSVLKNFDSPERGALVHWYYWATNVPAFSAALIFYPATIAFSSAPALFVPEIIVALGMIALLVFLVFTCVIHCMDLHIRGWRTMLPLVAGNPFKQVFRVTRRAVQAPVSPGHYGFFARLDSTRRRNGGQTDDEEVDNVTKFWFIVLLMACLCGYFFWDDMWAVSYANAVQSYDDTSSDTYSSSNFGLLSSQATTSVIVFFFVPIYQFVIRPFVGKCSPPVLWRIFAGLILQLISLVFVTWSVGVASSKFGSQALSDMCTYITKDIDPNYDSTSGESVGWFYLITPQVINGVSQLLVFPAVIELILNDAPHVMQGLLIGIWYAMQSIHVLVSIIETVSCVVYNWPYYLVKIALVLASTVTFGTVAYFYKRPRVVSSVSTTQTVSEVGFYQPLQEVNATGST